MVTYCVFVAVAVTFVVGAAADELPFAVDIDVPIEGSRPMPAMGVLPVRAEVVPAYTVSVTVRVMGIQVPLGESLSHMVDAVYSGGGMNARRASCTRVFTSTWVLKDALKLLIPI